MMATCQSSRDENTQFARRMRARFSVILTAAFEMFRILPMAMFEYRSVGAVMFSLPTSAPWSA